MGRYSGNNDIIGGAIDSAAKMYALVNAPEDRRRQQEREDLQLETMRTQGEAARAALDHTKLEQGRSETDRLLQSAYYKYQNGVTDYTPEELQAMGKTAKRQDAPWLPSDQSEVAAKTQAVKLLKSVTDRMPSLLEGVGAQNGMVGINDPVVIKAVEVLDGDRTYGTYENGTVGRGYNQFLFNPEAKEFFAELNVQNPDGTMFTAPATEPDEKGSRTADNAKVKRVTLDGFGNKVQNTSAFMDMVDSAGGWEKVWQAAETDSPITEADITSRIVANGGAGASALLSKANTKHELTRQWADFKKSDVISGLPPSFQKAASGLINLYQSTGGTPAQAQQQIGSLFSKAAELEISEAEMGQIKPAYQAALSALAGAKGSFSARMSVATAAIEKLKLKPAQELKAFELVKNTVKEDIALEEKDKDRKATLSAVAIKSSTKDKSVDLDKTVIEPFAKSLTPEVIQQYGAGVITQAALANRAMQELGSSAVLARVHGNNGKTIGYQVIPAAEKELVADGLSRDPQTNEIVINENRAARIKNRLLQNYGLREGGFTTVHPNKLTRKGAIEAVEETSKARSKGTQEGKEPINTYPSPQG